MGKTLAVITGASSGLGVVFARKLAAEHDLLLIARRKERLEALAAELTAQYGCKVDVLPADLTDEKDLAAVADRIAAEQNLGLLVNNAGFGSRGLFWESDIEVQEQMHRLHVMATVRLSHAALRNMVRQNSGGIINVASVASFVQRAGSVSYGATKRWMAAFTEGLYLELKGIGSSVKVQALCPGFTFTEFHATLGLKRPSVAPSSLWLQPDFVVGESLKALKRGKLLVVPGWKYKAIVALVSKLPTPLRLAFEAAGSTKKSRWQ
ncbi:MAG TPA: SDR family oxidoreductase [Terracidiphilus sp.]|nr:SDR family oxidoreductase [Terracidiphilus sp.]